MKVTSVTSFLIISLPFILPYREFSFDDIQPSINHSLKLNLLEYSGRTVTLRFDILKPLNSIIVSFKNY